MFISIIILIVILLLLPNFIYQVDPGYIPVTMAQISATVDVLENYRSEVSHYPSTSQGLKALYEKPAGPDGEKWKGPYITKREIPKMVGIASYIINAPALTIRKAMIYGLMVKMENRAGQAGMRILGIGSNINEMNCSDPSKIALILNSEASPIPF